ncbi:MAG: agmatine deiminase family protein [Bernardetiaceae bacterium]|nr:agmatine deiminase family protein [Bernardetiaceae bacterium]
MMNIRFPAEWEPQSAVQLTLPHSATDWADMLSEVMPCFIDIINAISRFQKVLLVSNDKTQIIPLLEKPEAIIWAEGIPSNDTWARDHAPLSIVVNQNNTVLLNFIFNGWGLKFAAFHDHLINEKLKAEGFFGKIPMQNMGFVFEGGAIESDGEGTLLTTAACLLSRNRNPHLNKTEIESFLLDTFGAERLLWLHHGALEGDDTDAHIDTLARFCAKDTIAYVGLPPQSDSHYPSLLAMQTELKGFRQRNGAPYRLVPLPFPDAIYSAEGHRLPATYANFLIINNALLLPIYKVRQDEEAIACLKKIFPEREIIPIDCRPLIEQHGSLHCVTMQYPKGIIS